MNADLHRLARDDRLTLRFRRDGSAQRVRIVPDERPCPTHERRTAVRCDGEWRARGSEPVRDVRVWIE